MSNLAYIESAGVRVPSDWKISQLQAALKKRKIKFNNEEEIMRVFGAAVELKRQLEKQIQNLYNEIMQVQNELNLLKGKLNCPHCHKLLVEEPPAKPKGNSKYSTKNTE